MRKIDMELIFQKMRSVKEKTKTKAKSKPRDAARNVYTNARRRTLRLQKRAWVK
jgi:hypothetical protein